MRSFLRFIGSLFLTALLFTLTCFVALNGGFKYFEMHYYQPRKVNTINSVLDRIGREYDEYTDLIINKICTYTLDDSTKTYIERNATDEQVTQRTNVTGKLFESIDALDGIRIVSGNGEHIHFSTYSSDILRETENLLSYKNFKDASDIPFDWLATSDNGEYADTPQAMALRTGVYYDAAREMIVFSVPYFDTYTAYRGTAVFYVYANDFTRNLIAKNLLPLNTRSKLVSPDNSSENLETAENTGYIFNIPSVGKEIIANEVEKNWHNKRYGIEQLVEIPERNDILILLSGNSSGYITTGYVCSENEFTFSQSERLLILTCIGITLFLLIFMLFNLRQDDMVIIKGRLRKFEISLYKEYLRNRDKKDYKSLQKDFALRRQDITAEIMKNLGRKGRKHSKEVSKLIDQTWQEFMMLMSVSYKVSLENLKQNNQIMPEAEQTYAQIKLGSATPVTSAFSVQSSEIPEADAVEELEEIPEADAAEELEEIPEADAAEKSETSEKEDSLKELSPEEIPSAENSSHENPEAEEENNVTIIIKPLTDEEQEKKEMERRTQNKIDILSKRTSIDMTPNELKESLDDDIESEYTENEDNSADDNMEEPDFTWLNNIPQEEPVGNPE